MNIKKAAQVAVFFSSLKFQKTTTGGKVDTQDKNPLLYLFGKVWHYSQKNKRNVILYWWLFVMSEIVNTFGSPLIMAQVMSIVSVEGITQGNIKKLYLLLGLSFVCMLVSWAFHGPARLLESANGFLAKNEYRAYLLNGVMNMPLKWHTDHHSGDTIDKISKGTNALYNFSSESFLIIKAFIKLIGSVAMVMYFSYKAGVIILVLTIISVWITMRFDKVISPQYRILNKNENEVAESVFDSISNISSVIVLRVEKLVFDSIMHKVMKQFDLFKRNNFLNEWKWFFASVACEVMAVTVLALYFYQHLGVKSGVITGSLYLLINYLDKIGELFYRFTSMYGGVIRDKFKIINAEELARDFKDRDLTSHALPQAWEKLEIKNLSFSHQNDGEQRMHLDNVSLDARKGERIALIGTTGCGKSTYLMNMGGVHKPQSVTLKVDGSEVEGGFPAIARGITLVQQSPEIFTNTILWNITLGAEYDLELIHRYTDMAGFTSVVESLPKQFDSTINEKGVNLSGGQIQRLALSRGLLACHDKEIVLLDEPTASLDLATEMEVYRNIFRGFKGKTVISSIHRLHLLPLFDTIYMFDSGRVVASGSLDYLLATSIEFQTLWQKQFVEILK